MTLQVGNGGSGSIRATSGVTLSNSGALVFNQAQNSTFTQQISGNGSLVKNGANILSLTNQQTTRVPP